MGDVPCVQVRLVFKSPQDGGRRTAPVDSAGYRPHIVVGERNQKTAITGADGHTLAENYLAVAFTGDGRILAFDREWDVRLRLWNTAADYSALFPGATFTIREDARIVGSGEVLSGR